MAIEKLGPAHYTAIREQNNLGFLLESHYFYIFKN